MWFKEEFDNTVGAMGWVFTGDYWTVGFLPASPPIGPVSHVM